MDTHVSDLNCVPNQGSQQVCRVLLGSSRTSDQGSHWSGHLTVLQNVEHMIKALCIARFKFHGHQKTEGIHLI